MAISVLMVCLGNICRSPLAEAALRQHAAKNGHDIIVDSAGTGDWQIGHPPDPRAQAVALRLGGIDISRLRGRQVSREDFHRFNHIVVMDKSNLHNLRALAPKDATAQLSMLLDYVPEQAGPPVPDPYYDGDEAFEQVWQLVNVATEKLMMTLA